jgi:hypothetical protein
MLFLSFLTPIINGAGTCHIEPQTRGGRRMDVVVWFNRAEYIVELKIWHGAKRDEDAHEQLAAYLRARGHTVGWLLSFTDQLTTPRHDTVVTLGDITIKETIIAYRDKE